MNAPLEKTQRPRPVAILCIFLFVMTGLNLLGGIFSITNVSPARAAWMIITTAVAFVSVIGLWKMRRWGVFLYLGGYIAGAAMFYIFPPAGGREVVRPFLLLAVPLVYCAFVLPYWKRLK